jgi:hypothetical protein
MPNGQTPFVLQFLPCEWAAFNPTANAWLLTRPLHTTARSAGSTTLYLLPELWLYVQLTDGIGTYDIRVECRTAETSLFIGASRIVRRTFPPNRLDVVETAFCFRNLPLPESGVYEFRLLADDIPLQPTARLLVR